MSDFQPGWIIPADRIRVAEYWLTRRAADVAPGFACADLPDVRVRYRWNGDNAWVTGCREGVQRREPILSCLHSNNGWRLQGLCNPRADYWRECIESAADEANATLTSEQIESIAAVLGAHENYGMAFGDDVSSSNLAVAQRREVAALKAEIRRERDKVTCRTCNGTGKITTVGGTLMATSSCWKCNGAGRHAP